MNKAPQLVTASSTTTAPSHQKTKLISVPDNVINADNIIIESLDDQAANPLSVFDTHHQPQEKQQVSSFPPANEGDIEIPAAYQLPEFKDPAEELEAFQEEKEKEKEIENLQRQLVLLEQHREINQQNLQDESK